MFKWEVWRNGRILSLLLVLLLGFQSTVIALSPTPQSPSQEPAPTVEPTLTATPFATPSVPRGKVVHVEPRLTATPTAPMETAVPVDVENVDTAVFDQPTSNDGAPTGWFPNRDCAEDLRVMFLGNSITRGKGSSLPAGGNRENDGAYNFGYRYYLEQSLAADNYKFDFVGYLSSGASSSVSFTHLDHNGFAGIEAQELGNMLVTSGMYDSITYPPLLYADPSDLILLHIGTNDVSKAGFDVDTEVADVADILNDIDTYSEEVVVILALIIDQNSNDPNYQPDKVETFNTALNLMAQDRIANDDKIVVVNMYDKLPDSTDYFDRLHPSNAGYAKMATTWFTEVQNVWPTCVEITTTPILTATANQLYTYTVQAVADPITTTYALVNPPTGMSIDMNTGAINWTPTVSQTGAHQIEVQATNGHKTDSQQFTISVEGFANITSTPPLTATVHQPYTYNVQSSAAPITVTYSLVNPPIGMTIEPNSGAIHWIPTGSQIGAHQIEVQVANAYQTDTQIFTVTVDGSQIFIPIIVKN